MRGALGARALSVAALIGSVAVALGLWGCSGPPTGPGASAAAAQGTSAGISAPSTVATTAAPQSPTTRPLPDPTPSTTRAPNRTKPRTAAPRPTRSTALPAHSGSGHRVVYSISRQRVWLVDGSGRVVRTYLVSGRRSQPATGTYRVYSRSRWASSAVSDETMEYMVRFAHGTRTGAPIGFHSIPRHPDGTLAQSVAQLGRPLSAGCIRQRLTDARALWQFAPVGTAVVVVR